ncbi:MAG TPA: YkgJ family cysteine cluster protein [Deltaproteobacteria bacterium]|nr:YkgJ family cysteine cluster protein [Deltaproteobacteria bacterium]
MNNKKEKSNIELCNKCKQACCRYLTQKISAPRSIHDFDGLLWQLYHKNVKAFCDSTGWHLLVYNPCVHLKKNGKCAIYEKRPITCRDHDAGDCEYGNPISKLSVRYFDNYQSLEKYCKKKFKTWDKRHLNK